MKTHTLQHHLLTGLCFVALVAPAWAAQTTISAQIQPQSISLGDSAQLAVTIKGSQSAEPEVPSVNGLDITRVGQSSSMRSINGAVTSSVTHIYRVTADRAGSFTIPAITAAGAGSTPPITLRVDQGSGSQTRRAPPQGRAQQTAPSMQVDTSVDAQNQSAFLRVILPKHELTVGELVPVEVKACFRAGVSASLNGLPMLSSDAFTLNKLSDNPEQTREIINGAPYTVVTWTSSLSAVKAGEYPLNLDLPVMVRVKERVKRGGGSGRNPFKDFFGADSPFDDSMFEDSFFDDFFGQATEKPLTLHTDGAVVKIKALPLQGRPANFTGAVGQFALSSEASTTSGATGDPLTLKVNVTGQGNFGRVSMNGLPASADWKSYNPSSKFEPGDSSGTTGTKTFEQSIVPLKAGRQDIPAVSFSYFDPEKDAYVTKATDPIAVEIAANSATALAATPVPDSVANAPTTGEPDASSEGMAHDQEVPAHASSSLRPLILRPWFIAMNGLTFAVIILGSLLLAIRSRRARDPRRLEREAAEKAVKESLATMDEALKEKDDTRFFDAARRALQERLASQWQVPVTKVTLPEIRSRLNGHAEDVSTILQTADDVTYAGKRFTAPDLKHWRDLVKTQLQQLSIS
ncbi:MAG: BatD family protein [Prosthecobacter sp.]|uniref:BatD family protein n=1 Tax=Prosthecobacter sp. TaxID=1965333 RepID=UPI0025CC93CA|nr:BatD family protein [Prosthecobacter sp.]MCF7785241.1 BatD family protein [Prosthecobacter sp.]